MSVENEVEGLDGLAPGNEFDGEDYDETEDFIDADDDFEPIKMPSIGSIIQRAQYAEANAQAHTARNDVRSGTVKNGDAVLLSSEETDAEAHARELIAKLTDEQEAQILIQKLPVVGKLARQFVNPCEVSKYCQSFPVTSEETLENLYLYTQENYEGGKYQFQIRVGKFNGKVWRKILSDLPGTKKRDETDDDNTGQAAPQIVAVTPAPSEPPADEFTVFEKILDKKERIDAVLDRLIPPAPKEKPERSLEETLAITLLEKGYAERVIDKYFPQKREKDKESGLMDVVEFALNNPEKVQQAAQVIGGTVAGIWQQMFGNQQNAAPQNVMQSPRHAPASPVSPNAAMRPGYAPPPASPFDLLRQPAPETSTTTPETAMPPTDESTAPIVETGEEVPPPRRSRKKTKGEAA